MSRFYGTVRGDGREVSRIGRDNSGLRTTACTTAQEVVVHLSSAGEHDYVTIDVRPHGGGLWSDGLDRFTLFEGRLNLSTREGRMQWARWLLEHNRDLFAEALAEHATELLRKEFDRGNN